MNLKKIAYYLGIALCLASPLAFGICMLIGLDNTIPLSLMITSNVCRICSLEAEMTENLCRKSIKNAVEVKEYQILYHLRELRQQIGNAKMTFGIFDTERKEL